MCSQWPVVALLLLRGAGDAPGLVCAGKVGEQGRCAWLEGPKATEFVAAAVLAGIGWLFLRAGV